jgi:hypothetical protein
MARQLQKCSPNHDELPTLIELPSLRRALPHWRCAQCSCPEAKRQAILALPPGEGPGEGERSRWDGTAFSLSTLHASIARRIEVPLTFSSTFRLEIAIRLANQSGNAWPNYGSIAGRGRGFKSFSTQE